MPLPDYKPRFGAAVSFLLHVYVPAVFFCRSYFSAQGNSLKIDPGGIQHPVLHPAQLPASIREAAGIFRTACFSARPRLTPGFRALQRKDAPDGAEKKAA